MKCDSCGTVVKAGTAVCPKCDAILDMNAFSTEPPPADEAEPGPMKPRASSTANKKVKRTASGTGAPAAKKKEAFASNSVRHMPPAPPRLLKPDPSEVKEDIDWRQMSKDAVAKMKPQEEFKAESAATPEQLAAEAKSLFKNLGFADKIAGGGAVGTILSSFFPWKETFDQGDHLGLMSLGAPVFLAAIAVASAVMIRVKNMMPKANPMTLWLTQFGSACFCVLWCLVFIKTAWDPTRTRSPVGNAEMWASSPSMGVVLALLFSLAAVAGTLLGLREKPQR
jgi:hypothetical protein